MVTTKTDLEQKFTETKKKLTEIHAEFLQTAKAYFKEAAASLFENNPTLVAFRWTQYTPYWNDGDECVFSAHIDYPELKFNDTEENAGDDGDGFEEIYDRQELTQDKKRASADIKKFLRAFDTEQFKQMFDDHCQVTVTRDGVDVESYEHD